MKTNTPTQKQEKTLGQLNATHVLHKIFNISFNEFVINNPPPASNDVAEQCKWNDKRIRFALRAVAAHARENDEVKRQLVEALKEARGWMSHIKDRRDCDFTGLPLAKAIVDAALEAARKEGE